MPTAPDDLRDLMGKYFGDRIDDSGPSKFLKDSGFILSRDWEWTKPNTTYKTMSPKEYECILFLHCEWDYGGFTEAQNV